MAKRKPATAAGAAARPKLAGAGQPLPHSATVLLLVDFINPLDFPGAEAMVEPALAAARRAAALKARLGREGVQTLYANDNYGTWQSEFRDLLGRCATLPGPRGEIARILTPSPTDITLLKPRHSAFFATPLDLLLREMGAKRLVVCGLSADMCVQITAMDGYVRGYRVCVPSDATAAESEDRKRTALTHLARSFDCATPLSRNVRAAA